MKRSFLVKTVVCLAIALVINLQKPFAQNSKSMTEVTNAVEQLRKAMVDADTITLDKLTAAELSYDHSLTLQRLVCRGLLYRHLPLLYATAQPHLLLQSLILNFEQKVFAG